MMEQMNTYTSPTAVNLNAQQSIGSKPFDDFLNSYKNQQMIIKSYRREVNLTKSIPKKVSDLSTIEEVRKRNM